MLRIVAYVDSIDVQYGRSPLWRATERGHEEVVKLLLASGAELDLTDHDGRTPLSRATANGHEAVVNLLQPSGYKEA
jgi:ankyrin repeat protein